MVSVNYPKQTWRQAIDYNQKIIWLDRETWNFFLGVILSDVTVDVEEAEKNVTNVTGLNWTVDIWIMWHVL